MLREREGSEAAREAYARLMAEAQVEYDAWETRFVGRLLNREQRLARRLGMGWEEELT